MEARWHVEFTGGSRAIATIDHMDSAYYDVGGDLFKAGGIVGSTRNPRQPCSRRHCPHHHWISRRAVDLVEGAARQSGAEVRGAQCGRAATPSGAAPHGWGTTGPAVRNACRWPHFGPR